MIPARIEFQNVICNPGVSCSDIQTINPFTTNTNNPSVKSMAGKDNITTRGLRILLTMENIRPANKKTPTLESISRSLYPVPNKRTAIQRPNEFNGHLIKNTKN